MRMISRCPSCGAGGHWFKTGDSRQYQFDFGWKANYEWVNVSCPSCGSRHRVLNTSYTSNRIWTWPANTEQLVDGEDYEVVFRRGGVRKFDGERPVTIAWCSHPLHGGHDYDRMVLESIRADPQFANPRKSTRLAILPAFASDAMRAVADSVDEVWVLEDHVTCDAVGPFPSLRAEVSIFETLIWLRPTGFVCFWPTVFFAMKQFVSIVDQEALIRLWSAHSRMHIKVDHPKDLV